MSELLIIIISMSAVFGLLGLFYLGIWLVCRFFDKAFKDVEDIRKDEGD